MGRFSPTVVDHFTNPRNSGQVADASVRAFVGNPVCGDQILLTAAVADGVVTDIRFQAFGCSASLAVASLLTEVVKGKGLDEVAALDADRVVELAGGLTPDQRHVAGLAADVAHRLVDNFHQGVNDDDPISCGA
ncbi:iron-sulfur cluster assembly scaffold protein [Actinokineospora globicatena]|uniref:Similarity with Nitrogen-fixing NifU-like proteins n=1 Tax=Actinokineospora globicatena TaxID=103729 RepID=A0A9W6QK41_9PSEU|nr:iron-sulfur cluster assembly scaffold protein [Actinokineospora globicatena]MCP2303350.1 nitrogen fixation protein NifU [Actinokineospora globicatena]GLW79517.1 similarity with Nitrogen-fixing NifU-like proteins [Actinokineospora globicatena]GLW86073.1 similarity with Nitrogen-fixing NifU-like proteins [Actinokineospora globicatena]GLW90130.1 similarity with Nitrogen-fixing NifU-like proteins [Actinokineospora globicatena]